tara:strand:+ start:841 stop:1317 length:477 start_codon:yes stop_codon:yes gene_type:complete
MTDRILKIEELDRGDSMEDRYIDGDSVGCGYRIYTDRQVISLLISNGQQCCETWGYLLSEQLDDGDDFIGANITSIAQVKEADITSNKTNGKEVGNDSYIGKEEEEYDDDYGDGERTVFINIHTDRGTLQFKAYNSHNGYYGHTVRVHSEQLDVEEVV